MPAFATPIACPGSVCAIFATLALAWAQAAGAQVAGGFTAPDDPAIPALVSSLRGCLDSLPASDRRVLALRAGLGGHAPQLTAQVAAAVSLSPAAVGAAEVSAIRKLETLRRRGACQVQAAATPAPAVTTPAPAATPAATTTTPAAAAKPPPTTKTPASGDSTTSLLEVVVPALLVLAFIAGISLELNRRPRGR